MQITQNELRDSEKLIHSLGELKLGIAAINSVFGVVSGMIRIFRGLVQTKKIHRLFFGYVNSLVAECMKSECPSRQSCAGLREILRTSNTLIQCYDEQVDEFEKLKNQRWFADYNIRELSKISAEWEALSEELQLLLNEKLYAEYLDVVKGAPDDERDDIKAAYIGLADAQVNGLTPWEDVKKELCLTK